MHESFRKAIILNLIHSGASITHFQLAAHEDPSAVDELWRAIPERHLGDPRAKRAEVEVFALSLPPIQDEGKEAIPVYSNVGWAMVGAWYLLASGRSR